jgi:hypothetical protein
MRELVAQLFDLPVPVPVSAPARKRKAVPALA